MVRAGRTTCIATAVAIAGSAVAVAPALTVPAPPKITASGVGKVKLGKTYRSLRQQGLIAKVRPGCELGGPRTRSAALRAPLKGSVDLTLTSPRKVRTITVTSGAAARGVGIGGTTADITAAFPKARVDHSTDDTFGLTLVKIPSTGGGRLVFGVETTMNKVSIIGIPAIAFCE